MKSLRKKEKCMYLFNINQNPDPNIKVGIEQKSFLSATLRIGSQCCWTESIAVSDLAFKL